MSLALLLFLSSVLLFPAVTYAGELTDAKTVRVGMDDSNLFIQRNESGKPVGGYAYDYIQAIAAYAGWRVEYVDVGGFSDCFLALVNGSIDLLYDVSYSEERAEDLLFPEYPMGTEYYYLYCLADNSEFSSEDYSYLDGKKVGLTTGTIQHEWLVNWCSEKGIELDFVSYSGETEKAEALLNGEIDLIYSLSMLAEESYSAVAKIGSSDFYLAANNKRIDIIDDINNAYSKIESVNPFFIENLKEEYYSGTVLSKTLSADEYKWISDKSVLRIGYLDDYMPLCKKTHDGQVTGLVKDIVPLLLENIRIGEELTTEFYGYSNDSDMIAALANGDVDAVFPVYSNINYGIDNNVSITSVVFDVPVDVVYKGTYNEESINTIAVTKDNKSQDYFVKQLYPKADILYCRNSQACLDAVLEQDADATIINGFRISNLLETDGSGQLYTIRLTQSAGLSFAVREGDSTLLSLLNRSIVGMDESQLFNYAYNYVQSSNETDFFHYVSSNKTVLLVVIVFLLVNTTVAFVIAIIMNQNKKKLEEANAAKTSFLFNMSHDIRTPMNAILGFTDMAKKNLGNTEKLSDYLDKTQEAGTLLLSLINSVLEMSRIESGKAELEESPDTVTSSFVNIKSTMEELAKKKDINLSFSFGKIEDNYVYADIDRCNRVFINLVSNAIKYTGKGGRVKVRCEQIGRKDERHGLYRYTFDDNGIGMSKEFQKNLFDVFTRERNSTTSGIQGSGLGLSVAKSFVELMGGTITCMSKLGVGTTFTVDIPFRLCEDDDDVLLSEVGAKKTSVHHSAAESKKPAFSGRRILLVEDNEMNREIATFILEEEEMIVEEAEDGSIAVEMMKEKGPEYYDAIIMDIQMPVMNGYEATKAIRAMYPDALLPIIALSANAFAEDKAASLAAGMNDHVAKPINVQTLMKVLARYL